MTWSGRGRCSWPGWRSSPLRPRSAVSPPARPRWWPPESSRGSAAALTSAVVLGMIAGLYADDGGPDAGLRPARVRRLGRRLDRRGRRWPAHRAGVVALGVPGQRPDRRGGPGRRVRRPRRRPRTRRGCAAGWPRAGRWCPRALIAGAGFLLPNVVLFTMTVAGFSFQFLTALYLQDILGLDAAAHRPRLPAGHPRHRGRLARAERPAGRAVRRASGSWSPGWCCSSAGCC